ncbi:MULTISPECIES: hypothetical protein [unclassified Streptomyces]|uniref:hypothetical protein n=1 Tax=unclassified Streptomyces TaxID=2593676 RepID=UPI0015D514EC|nr:hypothetical protein [Streptomyces sp. Ru87]
MGESPAFRLNAAANTARGFRPGARAPQPPQRSAPSPRPSRRLADGRRAGKLAAGFTNSASKDGDKSSTLAFFATFAAQRRRL